MQLTEMSTVVVPVSDQDRAIAFYVDTLGFELRGDWPFAGGERWVEVAPPGGATTIALVRNRETGIETRIAWCTNDVEADHAELRERRVDVDARILREGDEPVQWGGAPMAGTPPMFLLRDPDGNSFLIVQQV